MSASTATAFVVPHERLVLPQLLLVHFPDAELALRRALAAVLGARERGLGRGLILALTEAAMAALTDGRRGRALVVPSDAGSVPSVGPARARPDGAAAALEARRARER